MKELEALTLSALKQGDWMNLFQKYEREGYMATWKIRI